MNKRIVNLIAGFILGIVPVLAAVKMISKDIGIDLKKAMCLSGIITDKGVTDKSSVLGEKIPANSKVFYFHLNHSPGTFAIYRPGESYMQYDQSLHVGDSITVYYRETSSSEINMNVFQVEKDGRIIVDYESYNENHHTAAAAAMVAGLCILALSIVRYRRNWD